jgi:dTDP-4-dehydrorhamnose 3,5-epimerase
VIVEPLAIAGVVLLRSEDHVDERGSFRRNVDIDELIKLGMNGTISQVSTATNTRRGTIRGMHYQVEPHGETKTLWCTRGSVFDVLVDLRFEQPTYGSWVGVQLSEREPLAVYVPPGIAHGYQTLEDESAMIYLIDAPYAHDSARSLRWNDPAVGIEWPLELSVISARDQEAPSWPPQR